MGTACQAEDRRRASGWAGTPSRSAPRSTGRALCDAFVMSEPETTSAASTPARGANSEDVHPAEGQEAGVRVPDRLDSIPAARQVELVDARLAELRG